MDTISVRYIVDDVEASIRFYVDHLGFKLDMHQAPPFAALSLGDFKLFLSQPGAAAAAKLWAGRFPLPAGGTASVSR